MEIILLAIVVLLVGIYIRRYYISEKGLYLEGVVFPLFRGKKKKEPVGHTPKSTKPENAETKLLYSQAIIFFDRGELDEAEKKLIQITSTDHDFHEAGHKLGLVYLKRGDFEKAESIFKQLVSRATDDAIFYSNLGRALYEQEKFGEALASYLKSIDIDDSRPGRFLSAAEVYRQLGDNEKAQEMYQKALELDPSNIDYLLTFAHFLIENKRFDKATFYLEKVLKHQPDNAMALEMMKEIKD
jgi:Tfp pilus assembly protein PilF